ncbi:MAG: glycosyltransferase family 9 protein [Planctomycetota bacterium]
MGDVLQIIPVIHGLKKKYHDASIHVLVSEGYRCLLDGNPCVDRVISIPLDALNWYLTTPGGIRRAQTIIDPLVETLDREKYDLIITRQFSMFEMCLLGALNTENILGPYYAPESDLAYWRWKLWNCIRDEFPTKKLVYHADNMTVEHTQRITQNRRKYQKNLVDVGLDMTGVPDAKTFYVPITSKQREWAKQVFRDAGFEGQRVLGVQTCASEGYRYLTLDMIVETLDQWQDRWKGRLVFFGSGDERERVKSVIMRLKRPEMAMNLAGETSLLELGACLEQVDLLMTPDTGTLHMAAAVNTPTVSLFFSSAYPWQTGPYGKNHLMLYSELPCSPCRNPEKCVYDGFCRSLHTPSSVAGVLDFGFELLSQKIGKNKDKLISKWKDHFAAEYRARRMHVLYTGWQEIARPLVLQDLTVEPEETEPDLMTCQDRVPVKAV